MRKVLAWSCSSLNICSTYTIRHSFEQVGSLVLCLAQSTHTLHSNHLCLFFNCFLIALYPFDPFHPRPQYNPLQNNMNEFGWYLIINLLDESYSVFKRRERIQMVMPFEFSKFISSKRNREGRLQLCKPVVGINSSQMTAVNGAQ